MIALFLSSAFPMFVPSLSWSNGRFFTLNIWRHNGVSYLILAVNFHEVDVNKLRHRVLLRTLLRLVVGELLRPKRLDHLVYLALFELPVADRALLAQEAWDP